MHHLQNGPMIVRIKAGLVKSLPIIPKRFVHVNIHLAILACFRTLQQHPALEILGCAGASVNLVVELL